MGALLGGMYRWGSFTRDFERHVKEGSGNGASPWEFCERDME
jgi:hypothetical protein